MTVKVIPFKTERKLKMGMSADKIEYFGTKHMDFILLVS